MPFANLFAITAMEPASPAGRDYAHQSGGGRENCGCCRLWLVWTGVALGRKLGRVVICEIDPVKALEALMDGYTVMPALEAADW